MVQWVGRYLVREAARFVKQEGIALSSLTEALDRAEQGLVDAHLGAGLIKQRVARAGSGRSGGYRFIIAVRQETFAVVLAGFAKNEQANLSVTALEEAKNLAKQLSRTTLGQRKAMVRTGLLVELGPGSGASQVREPKQITRYDSAAPAETGNADAALRTGLIELADALHQAEVTTEAEFNQSLRALLSPQPLAPDDIRALRDREGVSQVVFARVLNVSVNTVSQWERGEKRPTGSALKLLRLVERHGLRHVL